MNVRPLISKLLLGLLGIGALACSKVEKVEDPVGNTQIREGSLDNCNIYLVGSVIDATTRQAIKDAEVYFNFDKVFSDHKGAYRLQLGEQGSHTEPELIKVTRNGYVLSTFEVDLHHLLGHNGCENDIHEILVDFVLTPEKAPVSITSEARTYSFDEVVTLLETDGTTTTKTVSYTVNIPEGAVSGPAELQLTPIHPEQILGRRPQEVPLKSFDLKVSGQTLNKPITVTFAPDYAVADNDPLASYKYSGTSNAWESSGQSATYDAGSQKVTASLQVGQSLITNTGAKFAIQSDELSEGPHAIVYSQLFENCNCGSMLVVDEEFSWPVEFKQPQGAADLFRILNLPISFVKKPRQETGFWSKVRKCEVGFVDAYAKRRTIIGTLGRLPFHLEGNYVLRIRETFDDCPVTSACHQGCP